MMSQPNEQTSKFANSYANVYKNGEKVYVLLLIGFFVQIALCFYSYTHIALLIQIILLCSFPVCAVLFRHTDYTIKVQMMGINLLFLCIWVAGVCNEESYKGRPLLILGGLICLTAGSLINFISLYKNFAIKLKNQKNLMAFFLCLLYALLAFDTIHDIPIYDSGAYYSWSIAKLAPAFDFTTSNIFDYCLAGHISVGYGLFALLGELISPFTSSGVHLINILLAQFSIFAFLKILEYIFPDYSSIILGMACAIYAFSPYVLGMAGIINIDNPGIYIFIIMVYCYIKKYRIGELFWAWVFVCTKEPHILYYAFYIMGIVLQNILMLNRGGRIERSFHRLSKRFITYQFYRCVPLVFWFAYYIAPGRNSWVAGLEGLFNNNGLHTIGFNLENTIVKLKEMMILNFNWIFVLVIIAEVIIQIKCRKKLDETFLSVLFPILLCLIGILFFNIFYIDYPHPRYFALGAELVVILGIIILLSIRKMTKKINFLLPIIVFLVIVQSYITIDPFTKLCFKSINHTDSNVGLVTASRTTILDDSSIYNREYSYYSRALAEVLRQVEYNNDSVLVFPEYDNIPRAYGYSERFLWNVVKEEIQAIENEDTIPIHIASEKNDLKGYKKIIYIEPCFFQNSDVPFEQLEMQKELNVRYITMSLKVRVFSGTNLLFQ